MHPVVAQVVYSFQQALEDLEHFAGALTPEELWRSPGGVGSVGFHIKHAAGSVSRLMTYVQGGELSPEQFTVLANEKVPEGSSAQALLADLSVQLERAEDILRSLDPATFHEARGVGRKRLPTTVGGLIVHVAEHTQRHVGQAIVIAKLVAGSRTEGLL